ncbi:MAG: hypothetical protein IV092_08650 [Burkholderiaceae bacterium]|nr:hypothetical protein [Burkholderiaceae bacterium]
MMTSSRLSPQQRPQPSWLWALLLCAVLLGSQSLGLAHRVVHAQVGTASLVLKAAVQASGDFAGHAEHSIQCQLFDQLCHGDGLTAQSLEFGAATPQGLQTLIRLAAAHPAPFWRSPARAPPALG